MSPTPFDRAFWLERARLLSIWDDLKIVLLYLLLRFLLRRVVDKIVLPAALKGAGRVDKAGRVDGASAARVRTLAGLVNSVVNYALIFIFGVMLLRAFGLDPVPLLTTASVAGLAVGFGAQKLVKDVISGFFILLENQYAVGEYVTIGAVSGTVETLGMRVTQVRDDAGRLFILSNGDISLVCNQSRGPVSAWVEIGVAASADVAKATDVVNAAGAELAQERTDLASAPSVQGLGAWDGAKLVLRVSCPVTAPAHLADAEAALRVLAHQRLGEAGISTA